MDIDNLSDELRTRLFRDAGRYERGRITDERLQDTLALVQQETDNDKMRIGELKRLFNDITDYKEQRGEVFNPNEGIISNFIIDGKDANQIATSLNTEKNRDSLVAAIKSARKIDVTYNAVENKEELIEELNKVLTQRASRMGKDILNEEDKEAIQILIERLGGISDEEASEIAEIPEFKSLDLLEKSLVNASVISTESREKYYRYWKNIETKFEDFDGFVGAVDDEMTNVERIIAQFNESQPLIESPKTEKEEEELQRLKEVYSDINKLTENAYLPSYIIKVSGMKVKSNGPEYQALELFRDFFSEIGREIPEQYRPKVDAKEAEARINVTAREDYDAEGGGSTLSIDPTAVDDIVDEIEEAEKEIDETKIDKETDPLFALLMRNKELKGEYDNDVIEEALKLIKSELKFETMGAFQKDLEKIVDKELEKFLDNFRKSAMIRGDSYIPLLDDELAVKYFDNLEALYTVNYYERGIKKSESFRKYSEAVKFINRGTERFFKGVGNFINLQYSKQRVPDRPVRRGRGGQDSTPVQYLGGITRTLQPKMSQVDLDRMKEIETVTTLISEFYVKPLTSNMVLLEDVPKFFTSKAFKDFPSIVASSNINMARRSMREGNEPIIEVDDLNTLNKFLGRIANQNELVYTDDLNNLFSDALNAYIKFFAGVDSVVEDESYELDSIIERSEILFGASLYDVASATEDKSELDEIIFEGESLSFWNNKQKEEQVSIENLIALINSDEWENYINTTGMRIRGFKTASERVKKKLLESDVKLTGPITHAMLEATDILRKMKGDKIYYGLLDISDLEDIQYVSNMIKEEHNIDLYGIDIYNITKSQSSFNDIAETYGFTSEIIYKVKGMFR